MLNLKPSEKPFANASFAAALSGTGMHLTKYTMPDKSNRDFIRIETTPAQIAEMMQVIRADNFETECGSEAPKVKAELLGKEDSEWKGGSYSALLGWLSGEIDLSEYLKERAKLQKSGFDRKLREKIAMVSPRRKRFNSEHDGEWSLDRKWDSSPFQATRKALGAGRTLDIVVNCCASGGVSAEQIDRFGVSVWAVSDLIEASGIQTRIVARYAGHSFGTNSKGKSIDGEILVRLKDPTQFVTPMRLAACFKTAFFRRPIFSLFAGFANLENGKVAHGLGSPDHGGYPIKFLPDEGKLTMSIGTMDVDANDMEREILSAIDATVKG